MNRLLRALVLMLPAASLACGADDREVEIASTRPFDEAFERVASFELEQNDSLLLVAPMKLAVSPKDGAIAVPDFSEGHVRIFDAGGKHLRTVGRKGNGPGEFMAPVSTAWDGNGSLHVLDIQRAIISIFDPAGAHVREVSLAKVGTVFDFAPLPDRGFLLLGGATPGDVLTRIDSTGTPGRAFLPIAGFKPAGASDARAWTGMLMPQMRVEGETAFVILAPADSVWMLDLARGTAASHPLRPPSYIAPRDPAPAMAEADSFYAWAQMSDRIRGLGTDAGRAFVTFARGPYDRPDATLMIREADGRVHAFTGAKIVQEVIGGRLLTTTITDTSVTLEYWRPRP